MRKYLISDSRGNANTVNIDAKTVQALVYAVMNYSQTVVKLPKADIEVTDGNIRVTTYTGFVGFIRDWPHQSTRKDLPNFSI